MKAYGIVQYNDLGPWEGKGLYATEEAAEAARIERFGENSYDIHAFVETNEFDTDDMKERCSFSSFQDLIGNFMIISRDDPSLPYEQRAERIMKEAINAMSIRPIK